MATESPTITAESIEGFRSLLADLGSPASGGGTRFAEVVSVPGLPDYGLDGL